MGNIIVNIQTCEAISKAAEKTCDELKLRLQIMDSRVNAELANCSNDPNIPRYQQLYDTSATQIRQLCQTLESIKSHVDGIKRKIEAYVQG